MSAPEVRTRIVRLNPDGTHTVLDRETTKTFRLGEGSEQPKKADTAHFGRRDHSDRSIVIREIGGS